MVGGGPVQVPPLPGQAENGPVIRQQGTALPPQGAADGPGGPVQEDDQAPVPQQPPVLPPQHRAAAGGQDDALPAAQLRQNPGLQVPEIPLAA